MTSERLLPSLLLSSKFPMLIVGDWVTLRRRELPHVIPCGDSPEVVLATLRGETNVRRLTRGDCAVVGVAARNTSRCNLFRLRPGSSRVPSQPKPKRVRAPGALLDVAEVGRRQSSKRSYRSKVQPDTNNIAMAWVSTSTATIALASALASAALSEISTVSVASC